MSQLLTDHGFIEQTTPRPRNIVKQSTFGGYDNVEKPKRRADSQAQSSIGGEAHAKLKINLEKPRQFAADMLSKAQFKMNLELALRTAVGVMISSLFQTKNPDADLTAEHPKYWAIFPDWYIIGGISYIAVACIFSCGRTIGANIMELCQQIAGVSLACIFSVVLCYSYEPHIFKTTAEVNASIADGTLMKITKSFSGTPYYVHNYDLAVVLPFMMVYNAIVMILPFETNTKRFATGYNLFFVLTILSPNDFNDSSKLKRFGDPYYSTHNTLLNLLVYLCLGVIGAVIALFVNCVPYPLFAIRKLKQETLSAVDTIQELVNLIVDPYCFKDMDAENVKFLMLKLERKFDAAFAKKDTMNQVLNEVWWEQSVGLNYPLRFQKSVTKPFVELYSSLLDDLRAMGQAMAQERCGWLHAAFMKDLQRDVYIVQLKSIAVFKEISAQIHDGHNELELTQVQELEVQMEILLQKFQNVQSKVYLTKRPTAHDVKGNIPLTLFLFSLQSFCTTMMEFPSKLKQKNHKATSRALHFVQKSLQSFVDPAQYSKLTFIMAFKVSLAVLIACFFSVYVFAYSATAATTIAYIMGGHIGGSFSITLNRVGGVVAGSIIPSVILFFICSYGCVSQTVVVSTSDIALFFWVTFSMYIKWKGGLESYGGLVSAYVASGVLLRGCDCTQTNIAPISSYANLAQMSVGIILFILVELAIWPQSAIRLLRQSVQKHLETMQTTFGALFNQNLTYDGEVDLDALKEIQTIVEVTSPALLSEQRALLREALFEPLLWRPPFSQQKYEQVLDMCNQLLKNSLLLFKLVTWFQYRKANSWTALQPHRCAIQQSSLGICCSIDCGTTQDDKEFSTTEIGCAIHGGFDTLHNLFGEHFRYADADQTALFMQIKEAFRIADIDGSGEIDAEEVKILLENIFKQSGAVKIDAIDNYVVDFMKIVDKDHSGKVSFDEFMEALENGLKLQVQVYQMRTEPVAVSLNRGLSIKRQASMTMDASPVRASDKCTLEDLGDCRDHDLLDIETLTLFKAADQMQSFYAVWLLANNHFENVSMEELLLLNTLVSGVAGIAQNLASLQEMTIK